MNKTGSIVFYFLESQTQLKDFKKLSVNIIFKYLHKSTGIWRKSHILELLLSLNCFFTVEWHRKGAMIANSDSIFVFFLKKKSVFTSYGLTSRHSTRMLALGVFQV